MKVVQTKSREEIIRWRDEKILEILNIVSGSQPV
jgi:hypothetical protein